MSRKEERTKSKKKSIKVKLFKVILVLMILGIVSGLTLLYGPWNGFREWLITTAMTTLSHQWMATIFYSDETIQTVLSNNMVVETGETTNTEEIEIIAEIEEVYENEYEEAILKKDEENDLYKVIDIEGKGYTGHLVVVYDPSKISVCTTKYLGTKGQYLVDMAAENDAVVAINGGGFIDQIIIV